MRRVALKPGSNKIWDPGRGHYGKYSGDQERKTNLLQTNDHLSSLIATVLVANASVGDDAFMDDPDDRESIIELDSHANILVIGQHAQIMSDTGRVAEVNPFTPDYKAMKFPIVDAAIQYDCPYNDQTYMLVI